VVTTQKQSTERSNACGGPLGAGHERRRGDHRGSPQRTQHDAAATLLAPSSQRTFDAAHHCRAAALEWRVEQRYDDAVMGHRSA